MMLFALFAYGIQECDRQKDVLEVYALLTDVMRGWADE